MKAYAHREMARLSRLCDLWPRVFPACGHPTLGLGLQRADFGRGGNIRLDCLRCAVWLKHRSGFWLGRSMDSTGEREYPEAWAVGVFGITHSWLWPTVDEALVHLDQQLQGCEKQSGRRREPDPCKTVGTELKRLRKFQKQTLSTR